MAITAPQWMQREVIRLLLERDVALNATATAGEGVKITGVKNNYMAGETVEFTLKTEKFYEVASVTVNGEVITASGGKYSYTLPEKCDFRQHRSDDDADRRGV